MSENSKIEWTDHTYNPWIGCTKVSPGCLNCYAEKSTRARVLRSHGQETWGKGAQRSPTKTRGEVLKWQKAAARDAYELRQTGQVTDQDGSVIPWHRPRVFCASLSDWLDAEVPVEWLADLLQLIHDTPNLDWLLLTKRPGNWKARLQAVAAICGDPRNGPDPFSPASLWLAGTPPPNVWLGTTCEDQTRADQRIPELLKIPAHVRFLSCEPLLGPVDLFAACFNHGAEAEEEPTIFGKNHRGLRFGVDWVIAGGESGPGARPMHPAWARSLRDQCQAAGVPFLFKQWGEWCPGLHSDDSRNLVLGPGEIIGRFGKKAAGRRLDGREWNEFPALATRATRGGKISPNPPRSLA